MSPRTDRESPIAELQDTLNHCSTRYGCVRRRLTAMIRMSGMGPNIQDKFLLQIKELDAIFLTSQAALKNYCFRTGEDDP